jgi:hypothetical protein
MRHCERHPDRKINHILRNLNDGSEYDLCKECFEEFTEWLGEHPQGLVEKAKNFIKGGSKP